MTTATKPGKKGESPLLNEAFTFHDLRAKSGSDAEDVQEANDRLAHDDMRTHAGGLSAQAATRPAGTKSGRMS
jgi:hypothetical protein